MKLSAWLRTHRISQRRLAQASGVPASIINRIANDRGDTSGAHWVKITFATDGAVRPEDHFPVPRRSKRALAA